MRRVDRSGDRDRRVVSKMRGDRERRGDRDRRGDTDRRVDRSGDRDRRVVSNTRGDGERREDTDALRHWTHTVGVDCHLNDICRRNCGVCLKVGTGHRELFTSSGHLDDCALTSDWTIFAIDVTSEGHVVPGLEIASFPRPSWRLVPCITSSHAAFESLPQFLPGPAGDNHPQKRRCWSVHAWVGYGCTGCPVGASLAGPTMSK